MRYLSVLILILFHTFSLLSSSLAHSVSFLETIARPLEFQLAAQVEARHAAIQSEVDALLDWYVFPNVSSPFVHIRLALLLRPADATDTIEAEPSLLALVTVQTECLSFHPSHPEDDAEDDAVTVARVDARRIRILYVCNARPARAGHPDPQLRALWLDWRNASLVTVSEDPVLFLGAARAWLLSGDGANDAALLHVQRAGGATSAVLLSRTSLARVELPERPPDRLVASCFAPNARLAGTVRRSHEFGAALFSLHRFSGGGAELLLETNAQLFADLDGEERRHCGLAARLAFAGCGVFESGGRVSVAVALQLTSPIADGGWAECGVTQLRGAVEVDGAQHVTVVPLQRAGFQAVPTEWTERRGDVHHTKTALHRCDFYNHSDVLHCHEDHDPSHWKGEGAFSNTMVRNELRGRSHRCLAARAWWRREARVERMLCERIGIGIMDMITLTGILFTAVCGLHGTVLLLGRYFAPS